MTHYRSGADFEREVRAHLVLNGYDVIRSAGSKTKVDLLAFKPGQVLVIQCKRNGVCPPAERVELLRVACILGAVPLVAGRPKVTFRQITAAGPKAWAAWAADEVTP